MWREMLIQFLSLPVHFVAACGLALFANWLGMRPWHRAHEAHWSKRAQYYWPVMAAGRGNFLVIPLMLDQAHRAFSPATFEWWVAADLLASLGVMLGSYPMSKALFPRLEFRAWLHRTCGGWISHLLVYAGLVVGILLMPAEWGWRSVLAMVVYLALQLATQFGLWISMLRLLRLVRPANERLQKIVADQSAKQHTRPPTVWLLESETAQAWALVTNDELLFTTGLLENCTDEEVSSITAHELAHLSESRWIIAARFLTSLTLMPLIFLSPLLHQFGAAGLLIMGGLMSLMFLAAPRLAHRLELRADCMATTQQVNEGDYARALLKLYQLNHISAVNPRGQHTHPSLYDRLLAAGVTPDFSRPDPPAKVTLIYRIYGIALVLIFIMRALQSVDS